MRILIYDNLCKDPESMHARSLEALLKERGAETVTFVSGSASAADPFDVMSMAEGCDAIFALGGDGTVLQASRQTKSLNVPIAGINLGKVGYLTEIELENLEEYIDRFFRKDYYIESRMMLNGQVKFRDGRDAEAWALNDVVVSRVGSLQILDLDIYVNDQLLTHYHSDGVIVTTPTGSTGYNLSAGGPIVEPGASLLTMTPICPHTLNQRSIILRPEDEIVIQVPESRGESQVMEVCFDGVGLTTLQSGDRIRVTKSEKHTDFIRFNRTSFLEVLRTKLGEN
jgi:NAD+ kinase